MSNFKTNAIAIAKIVAALAYVSYKQFNGLAITDVDGGIVALAVGGALGNWFSADAKKKDSE